MESDLYYIMVFVSPILVFIFCMIVLKVCWKWCCCAPDVMDYEESSNTPIYVIPIPINEVEEYSSDDDSVASVNPYAPPSYDSLDPLPPYWEKFNIPAEAPPAYSQLEIPSGAAERLGSDLPPEPRYTHAEEV